jgi:hypothetical protein
MDGRPAQRWVLTSMLMLCLCAGCSDSQGPSDPAPRTAENSAVSDGDTTVDLDTSAVRDRRRCRAQVDALNGRRLHFYTNPADPRLYDLWPRLHRVAERIAHRVRVLHREGPCREVPATFAEMLTSRPGLTERTETRGLLRTFVRWARTAGLRASTLAWLADAEWCSRQADLLAEATYSVGTEPRGNRNLLWIDARVRNLTPGTLKGTRYGAADLVDTQRQRRIDDFSGGRANRVPVFAPWGGGTDSHNIEVGPHSTLTLLFGDANYEPYSVADGVVFDNVFIEFELIDEGHGCKYHARAE